jgi:hypothetical protein
VEKGLSLCQQRLWELQLGGLEANLSRLPRIKEVIQQEVWDLHVEVLEALTVADFRLGKAYGLGRALAETAMVPIGMPPDQRTSVYPDLFEVGRLERIGNWISEVKTSFGAHAAYAVQGSLERWGDWVRTADVAQRDPAAALSHQGRVWRGLLTGEKQAVDLLNAMDYVGAAIALLKRISQLAQRFVWSGYGILIAVVVALVVGAVIGISDIGSLSETGKLAAQLVTAVAALGLSTKGVMSTLGKIVAKAEGPLWDSELDESCAIAATRLPTGGVVSRRPRADIGRMP